MKSIDCYNIIPNPKDPFIVGLLLTIGLPITLLATLEIFNPKQPPADREGALAALMIFGLPPTALGSWMIWNAQRKQHQRERDRLQTTFYRILQENQGYINTLCFAMETGLNGEQAQAYLNEKAKEFNADYQIGEDGQILYYFNLGKQISD
jgi:serine/threonine-protein kinase